MKRLALCLFLAALGCKKSSSSSACAKASDCAAGFSCNELTGQCGCSSDASCPSGQTCNAAGFCQLKLRCDSSADCQSGNICDTLSGTCIAQGACDGLDIQCQPGQVCKDFLCVPGCRKDGDCPAPSDVCSACPAGTSSADCPVGSVCVRGQCDTKLTCNYGDLCEPQSGDGGVSVCTADARGPYCQRCTRQAGAATSCGSDDNYCLIDGSKPLGQSFYCGVDCSQGQECPFGYICHDVRVVRAQNCDPDAGLSACNGSPVGVACDPAKSHAGSEGGVVNDDCEAAQLIGAVCDPATLQCVPQCLGTGETGVQAFCSCVRDEDCPNDTCDSATRACVISGQPCIAGHQPDDCTTLHAIHCAKETDPRLGAVGYCRIGQNCAPDQGYTCEILLGGAQ